MRGADSKNKVKIMTAPAFRRPLIQGTLCAMLVGTALASTQAVAQNNFVTIGTGGQTGVYYVAGQSICRFMNSVGADQGIRCNAPSTAASVYNIQQLRGGEFDFGFVQADHEYKALNGLPPFEANGEMSNLRTVFALHPEVLTLVARNDANIETLADLEGKRVNIGVPGSGSRDTFGEVMQAMGWTASSFSLAAALAPTEMASALSDNNLDVMTYVVGHPSGAIQEGLSVVPSHIVPVEGEAVAELLASSPYFVEAQIPGGVYPGADEAIPSFGVNALLVTTEETDADTVYLLVKSVFDNLDRFKRLHPAFAELQPEQMIESGISAPLHEGAIRYYQERGWL